MQDLQTLVPPLIELCRRAGDIICDLYRAPDAGEYEAKGDDSPLTRADLASHALLQQGLGELCPDVPVLSEESTVEDVAQRLSWNTFWLVDPLDGTKEFLARTGEFTINIALIVDHAPVLGVLYVPLGRKAYVGVPGQGAECYQHLDGQWFSHSLATRALRKGEPLVVLASRRHHGPKLDSCFAWLREQWGAISRVNSGSAIKFCQMADGEGDFYPRFSPCSEWDTAAGQALLEAAGGCLLGLDGKPLCYNCSETLLSPDFYAISDASHPLWRSLLREPGGVAH